MRTTPTIRLFSESLFILYHLSLINEKISNSFLSKFIDSDILWDYITKIESIESEFVYDFTMDGTNNFIGNFIIQHNCIDEFDKMKKDDEVEFYDERLE